MSTDRWHYDLRCTSCGSNGRLDISSDDWNRWGAGLTGFSGRLTAMGTVFGKHSMDYLTCDSCGAMGAEMGEQVDD